MKIAVIIVRVLMGLLFVFSGVAGLFNLVKGPELTGAAKLFMDGVTATRYFLPLLMGTQLVCGLAFLIGRFVPLAAVVIFPITLNILLYHAFVAPDGLVVAVIVLGLNLFLAYAYRKNYAALVEAKAKIV